MKLILITLLSLLHLFIGEVFAGGLEISEKDRDALIEAASGGFDKISEYSVVANYLTIGRGKNKVDVAPVSDQSHKAGIYVTSTGGKPLILKTQLALFH
jgi:hypothetical protein